MTSRKNGVNGNQTLSIGSGATGEFQDTTNSDSIASGDSFYTQVVTGTGTQIGWVVVSHLFSATSGMVKRFGEYGGNSTSTTARFLPLVSATYDTTESNLQMKSKVTGTFKNLYLNVTGNSVTTSVTVRFRKNSTDGNQVVSVSASTTGVFEDTLDTDNVIPGDLICYAISSTSSGTFTWVNLSCELSTVNDTNMFYVGSESIMSQSNNYLSVGGPMAAVDVNVESNKQAKAQFAYTASNLLCYLFSNGLATSTYTFRKNGANGNLSVSIASSTTGAFEDTTHTDSVVATDEINYRFLGGTGTNASVGFFGHLASVVGADQLMAWQQPESLPRINPVGNYGKYSGAFQTMWIQPPPPPPYFDLTPGNNIMWIEE
jgi:hypothetical protein